MTLKDIVAQIEYVYGRTPEKYITQLVNDALIDMGPKIQHYSKSAKTNLVENQRYYKFNTSGSDFSTTDVIDIYKVEVLDTDGRYNLIPKLTDSHRILKDDTDDSGTGDE